MTPQEAEPVGRGSPAPGSCQLLSGLCAQPALSRARTVGYTTQFRERRLRVHGRGSRLNTQSTLEAEGRESSFVRCDCSLTVAITVPLPRAGIQGCRGHWEGFSNHWCDSYRRTMM